VIEPPDIHHSRLLRDIGALTLIGIGVVAGLWAAAATDWRVLLAVIGLYAITAGVLLARGEE
jgi:uncharacterized membrane protein (Fun14 family)